MDIETLLHTTAAEWWPDMGAFNRQMLVWIVLGDVARSPSRMWSDLADMMPPIVISQRHADELHIGPDHPTYHIVSVADAIVDIMDTSGGFNDMVRRFTVATPHTYRIGATLLVRRSTVATPRTKRRAVTKPYGPPTRRKWT